MAPQVPIFAVLGALVLSLPACTSCLDVACGGGAGVTVIPPASADALELRVTVGDRETNCTVNLPITTEQDCGAAEDRVTLRSSSSGFLVAVREATGAFAFEVKQAGAVIYEATLDPDYETEPGSDDYCGGECRYANVTVDLTK